jgi:DHA1 family multidrug resistance protein-like MFS transporter
MLTYWQVHQEDYKMDTMRDAPVGQLIRFLTGNKFFQYPEEKPDFKLPEAWLQLMNESKVFMNERTTSQNDTSAEISELKLSVQNTDASETSEKRINEIETEEGGQSTSTRSNNSLAEIAENVRHLQEHSRQKRSSADGIALTGPQAEADETIDLQKRASVPVVPKKTKRGVILVDWYYSDDQENPYNWPTTKRGAVTSIIFIYTVVAYMSSAIYTSSEEGIEKEFHVNSIDASLGLSMYVLGYGVGPLVLSPLSEIAVIGRSPVYIVTMALFVILSIPTAFVKNFAGLVVLRFIQGFLCSPCLASGPATMGDIYSFLSLPFALSIWVVANCCGPSLGPLLSGFAVPVEGWRWSLFEIIWASAPVLVIMFLFLPETSTPTILLRRARRLRKLTGNDCFMSQSEIDQRQMTVSAVAVDALIKPLEITLKDPAMLFIQTYTAIIYSIFYSCKTSFTNGAFFL